MSTAACVLLLGNPWFIAMAKAKKAAAAPAAATSDDAGELFYSMDLTLVAIV